MKAERKRLPIYALLIGIYTATILLLYVLGFAVYSAGISTTKSFLNDSMRAETSFLMREFDDSMSKVNESMLNCTYDRDILRFSWGSEQYMSMYDQFQSVEKIQTKLLNIIQQYNFVKNVELHFPKTGKKIGVKSGLESIDDKELESVYDALLSREILMVKDNGDMKMLVSSFYTGNPKNSNIIITAEISGNKLAQMLEQYIIGKEYDSLLLVYGKPSKLIASTNNTPSNLDLQQIESMSGMEKNESGNFSIKFDEHYAVSYAKFSNFKLTLYELRPQKTMTAAAYLWFKRWIWIFSLVASAALIIYALISYKLIRTPIYNIITAFRKVEKGDYKVALSNATSREFNMLNAGFNRMASKLYNFIENELKQQYLIKEAELKFLQMQINPHFLYNTYFVLSSLMQQEKYDSAEKMSKLLGIYFEYITNSNQMVELSHEAAHARAYKEIQQMRFSRHLKVEFDDLPDGSGHLLVPRLIIQPLLENAFEHGVRGMKDAVVRVSFNLTEHHLLIMVEDNNSELKDEDIERITSIIKGVNNVESGIALSNIARRLHLHYGGEGGMFVCRSPLGGLKVMLKIVKREGTK